MTHRLLMRFDRKTIDHLGIKLYSSFPPVIAELISNSYDADAESIRINIDDDEKVISVIDDGNGMTFDELRDAYLVIGRNRREENESDVSSVKHRLVTGKKGLGKLAVFGVANIINVRSVSNGFVNSFTMNYSKIRSTTGGEGYEPEITEENKPTEEPSGTTITISEISSKSLPTLEDLSISLSKRFKFFDEDDFQVTLVDTNTSDEIEVKNDLYYDNVEKDNTWTFPLDFATEITDDAKIKKLNDVGVEGVIYTKPTPLQNKDVGFVVYSRGKLVQENGFFSDRANDNFHRYTYGHFSIDAIDKEISDDFVGTARRSVLWEQDPELEEIRNGLDKLLSVIQSRWRKVRSDSKDESVNKQLPIDFYDDVTSVVDKKALMDLQKSLVKNSPVDEDANHIANVMKAVKVQFRFQTFKEHVAEMEISEITTNTMEKLSNDWFAIETQELAKVATGRIDTINKFEEFIKNNASETKALQPFLEKFPWILEPRMTVFDREVTFSKILREQYPDEDLGESNRRIDFLCSNVNGEVFIIELKRPNIHLSLKEVLQTQNYRSFLLEKRPELDEQKVHVILISDNTILGREAKGIYDSLARDNKIKIRSYTEMLEQARQYHDNFIQAQDAIDDARTQSTSSAN